MNATVLLKSVDISIPGYRILRPIGEGGMASVFLAVQESLDREVALKVMSPILAANGEFAQRFLIEGKITAKLQHPNLVTVYDIGAHNGVYYLAAEYIPGGTLKERITEGGLSVAEILDIVSDIAQGLDFAHQKGFVHRDVKPGNVLFRNDGRVVLADFGIAKAMDGSNSSTVAGTSVGTPDYMSPEQARGEPVDGRSDLYSLGTMLFEMLEGHAPYQASDPFTVALMHVTQPVPQLGAEKAWLQPLITGLMAKMPAERFNTGAAYIEAMQKLVASAPEGATLHQTGARKARTGDRLTGSGATQQRTKISVGAKEEGRPAWMLPAGIGAGVLVAALVAWQLLSPEPAPPVDPGIATTAGTQDPPPANGTASPTANPQIKVPVPVDAGVMQLDTLIQQADAYKDYAFKNPGEGGRGLHFPQDDNAIDLYWKALSVDPENVAAKTGLTQVADWYYERAHKYCYVSNLWTLCRSLAENGLKAMPDHVGLKALVEDARTGESGGQVTAKALRPPGGQ